MKQITLETNDGTVITFYQENILYQTISGLQYVLSYREFDELLRSTNLPTTKV